MNIYLNELDWKVSKAGVEIVRYADLFRIKLLFRKTALHPDNKGISSGFSSI